MAKSVSIAPYSLLPADNLWRPMFDVYGDGNENGKKAMCFDWQNNSFVSASGFLDIFVSWSLIQSFRIQLLEKLLSFDMEYAR